MSLAGTEEGGVEGAPLSQRVRHVRDLLAENRPDRMVSLVEARSNEHADSKSEALRRYHAGQTKPSRVRNASEAQARVRDRRGPLLQQYNIKSNHYGIIVTLLYAVEHDPDRYGDLVEWVDEGRVYEANTERLRRQRAPRGPNDPHTRMGLAVDAVAQAVEVLEMIDTDKLDPTLWQYTWRPELKRQRDRLARAIRKDKA